MKHTILKTLSSATVVAALWVCSMASAQTDMLPSWNDGAAKQSILDTRGTEGLHEG